MVGPTSTNGPAADLALPAYGPSLQAPHKPGNHPLPKQLRFPGTGKWTNGKKTYPNECYDTGLGPTLLYYCKLA